MCRIRLEVHILELASDQPFRVKDRVMRVHRDLVLRRIVDETVGVGERDEGGRGTAVSVVSDDFDTVVLLSVDRRSR